MVKYHVRSVIALLLALCLLTACGAGAPETPDPVPEEPAETQVPEETPVPEEPSADLLPSLDDAALRDAMPEEDYQAFESFLPVLRGKETFRWVEADRSYADYYPDWEPFDADMAALRDKLWDGFGGEIPETLTPDRLAVQDIDGDGTAELVMLFQDMAYNYLVLSQREDAVYGTDFSVRWFMDLQKNGVYVGSGGAGYHTYYRMSFQNGRFEEKELAQKVEWSNGYGCDCTLDGQPVTEAEFDAWYTENMVGDVTWYAPGGAVLPEGM